VKDFLLDNIELLSLIEKDIRLKLPQASWVHQVLFGFVFLLGYFTWITLPIQLLIIWWGIQDSSKPSIIGKIIDSFGRSLGQLIALTLASSIWLLGTIFILLLEDLINLAGLLIFIGMIGCFLIGNHMVRKRNT
jgi:hypothetical protein